MFRHKRFKDGRYLIARGCVANDIQQEFDKANAKSREELLKPKQKSSSPAIIIPMVMDYNPNLPNIRHIIDKNLPILYIVLQEWQKFSHWVQSS